MKGAIKAGRASTRGVLCLGILVGVVASACGRGFNTSLLLREFNGGMTDSLPDPALSRADIAEERVTLTVRGALVSGYFTQGSTDIDSIAAWLERPEVEALAWEHLLRRANQGDAPCREFGPAATSVPSQPSAPSSAPVQQNLDPVAPALQGCAVTFRSRLFDLLGVSKENGRSALCAVGAPTRRAYVVSDATKLAASLDLAAIDVARMIVDEQVVQANAEARRGFSRGLREAAGYLRNRRWKPSDRAPTFGLAVKGGASSGVFSAGVTWRALTLIERYRAWRRANLRGLEFGVDTNEARFAVASGTSAGAIIAAVVDIFHQDRCYVDPKARDFREEYDVDNNDLASGVQCQDYGRRLLATLFTCKDQTELYCVDERPLWALVGSQKGLMDFKGLRELLAEYVRGDALLNSTELALTTVDFRWGGLYVQTDQDPSTVEPTPVNGFPSSRALDQLHRSIEASFVLPFIAWPVDSLRIGGQERAGVFLDGGIKSEIPLLALAQRGVERALVVGSGPPQITPTEPQTDAVSIAMRYLDVSLSAVTESEWRMTLPLMRYREGFEVAACKGLVSLRDDEQVVAFCTGNLRAACGGGAEMYRQGEVISPNSHEPGRRFDVMGIFRKEEVDPTFGYSFDPVQMQRLFNAGAEAARERCLELTRFLGMGDAPLHLRMQWCNEVPVQEPGLCTRRENVRSFESCNIEPKREGAPLSR